MRGECAGRAAVQAASGSFHQPTTPPANPHRAVPTPATTTYAQQRYHHHDRTGSNRARPSPIHHPSHRLWLAWPASKSAGTQSSHRFSVSGQPGMWLLAHRGPFHPCKARQHMGAWCTRQPRCCPQRMLHAHCQQACWAGAGEQMNADLAGSGRPGGGPHQPQPDPEHAGQPGRRQGISEAPSAQVRDHDIVLA